MAAHSANIDVLVANDDTSDSAPCCPHGIIMCVCGGGGGGGGGERGASYTGLIGQWRKTIVAMHSHIIREIALPRDTIVTFAATPQLAVFAA